MSFNVKRLKLVKLVWKNVWKIKKEGSPSHLVHKLSQNRDCVRYTGGTEDFTKDHPYDH